jgi:ketosteroid isomerase-like protein
MRMEADTGHASSRAAETDLRTVEALFAAVAARDLTAILSCYAADVRIEEAPSLPYGGVYHGVDGAYEHSLAFWRTWRAFQPATADSLRPVLIAGEGRVVVLWEHEAHDPRSGASVTNPVVGVYELRAGLITSARMFHLDTAALVRFLDHAS